MINGTLPAFVNVNSCDTGTPTLIFPKSKVVVVQLNAALSDSLLFGFKETATSCAAA
jgi:hypothetical protein